jgi:hypothetical protein
MGLKRLPGVARKTVAATGTTHRRGRRVSTGSIRLMSVVAVSAATCAMWAIPAGAASAAPLSSSAHRSVALAASSRHSSKVKVSISPKTSYPGESVRLSASIVTAGSTPKGSVKFLYGSKKLCDPRVSHRAAHCYVKFSAARSYKIEAVYSGDSTHRSASSKATATVKRLGTSTAITSISPGTVDAGSSAIVSVSVSTPSGTPAATGTVQVAPTDIVGPVDPSYLCTAKVIGGKGHCTVTPPNPSYGVITYEATYSGSASHAGSKSTGIHELVVPDTTTTALTFSANPVASGGSETLTATVVNEGGDNISPAAGGSGTVTFTSDGVAIAGCTDVALTYAGTGNNVATCTFTTGAAGTPSVEAAYSGDPVNLASSDTKTLTIS